MSFSGSENSPSIPGSWPPCKQHLDRFSGFCTAHGRKSLYSYTLRGANTIPLKISHSRADLQDSHLIHGSLGPSQSSPKRHLDRFSHFCTAHESWSWQSGDRQTDHATPSVAIGRIYVIPLCGLIMNSAAYCTYSMFFFAVRYECTLHIKQVTHTHTHTHDAIAGKTTAASHTQSTLLWNEMNLKTLNRHCTAMFSRATTHQERLSTSLMILRWL